MGNANYGGEQGVGATRERARRRVAPIPRMASVWSAGVAASSMGVLVGAPCPADEINFHQVRPRRARRHEETHVGSVIKKRRKRMAKKKHRKLLKKTRIQRRRAGK